MEFLVDIISSAGSIFGPAMLLAGLAALRLCRRATWWNKTNRARRTAIRVSLLPPILGVVGAIVGLCVVVATKNEVPLGAWQLLGNCILFGVIVGLVPLMWSLALPRRPDAGTPHSGLVSV